MNTELQVLAEGYLKSGGYSLLDVRQGFLLADRLGLGGERETCLLWVLGRAVTADRFPDELRRLLDEIRDAVPRYPDARYHVLARSAEGLTQDFRSELAQLRVKLTFAALFFDAPFRIEEAAQHVSAIRTLRERGAKFKRVPQPYSLLDDGQFRSHGPDLFTYLFEEIRKPEAACLHLVVGAAGMGKSVLFESLFSRYYEYFLTHKQRRELCARPIPFVPDYLRGASSLRTDELIRNFLHSDVAAAVDPTTFRWLLANGFSAWFFDGLDELYREDPGFFEDILELLTRPGSKAKFLVCARDSLLTSSDEFVRLIQDWFGGQQDAIRVYRLDNWAPASKRTFAWLSLQGRMPSDRETDPPEVSGFIRAVTQNRNLAELSSLPYYCGLLFGRYRQGLSLEFPDDQALVEFTVAEIIKREEEKGLLKQEEFVEGGVQDWLETVGFEFLDGDFKGLSVSQVSEYGELVLKAGLVPERVKDALFTLTQFPLLSEGVAPGLVSFKHELVAEFLAAQYLLRRIPGDVQLIARSLSRRGDQPDSLMMRYLAKNMPKVAGAKEAIHAALKEGALSDKEVRGLLSLLLLADPSADLVQKSRIRLEGRDLTSLRFIARNLQRVSFRQCNLTNASFRRCQLEDALFEGSRLSGTRFDEIPANGLRGARFGAYDRFDSIYIGARWIGDRESMGKWVCEATGIIPEVQEPCPAAFQVCSLFLKFLRPDGSPRRDSMPEMLLTRGKRYPDAPTPEECVKACTRFGYLEAPDFRHHVARTRSDRYGDMRCFVTEWRLSAGVRELLNSLCRKRGCQHVP